MEINNVYKTRDLAEAAALLSSDGILLEVERQDGVCWFVFDQSSICASLANKFYFGELLVNARTFHESMNRLKNMIFRP